MTDNKPRDPRTYLIGGRRCALEKLEDWDDFYVAVSPRNGRNAVAEGPWEDWVTLARNILDADQRWREASQKAGE
jgi:hypothetical protein